MSALLPDLAERRRTAELMDDPDLDEGRHRAALRALRTVNALSGTAGRVWKEIVARDFPRDRPLRVLDLACGGGEVAIALARRAAGPGLSLEVHACDRSPVALSYAREAAAAAGVELELFRTDVLAEPMPSGYDLICCSLFLHHLAEEEAVQLLRAMAEAAPAILVQDLRRTSAGRVLAWLTLNTVARSEVACVDGLRSVAAAFTLAEVAAMAADAGLRGHRLRPCWPQRWVLSWGRA